MHTWMCLSPKADEVTRIYNVANRIAIFYTTEIKTEQEGRGLGHRYSVRSMNNLWFNYSTA